MENVVVCCMTAILLEEEYTKISESNENMMINAHSDVSPLNRMFFFTLMILFTIFLLLP